MSINKPTPILYFPLSIFFTLANQGDDTSQASSSSLENGELMTSNAEDLENGTHNHNHITEQRMPRSVEMNDSFMLTDNEEGRRPIDVTQTQSILPDENHIDSGICVGARKNSARLPAMEHLAMPDASSHGRPNAIWAVANMKVKAAKRKARVQQMPIDRSLESMTSSDFERSKSPSQM